MKYCLLWMLLLLLLAAFSMRKGVYTLFALCDVILLARPLGGARPGYAAYTQCGRIRKRIMSEVK